MSELPATRTTFFWIFFFFLNFSKGDCFAAKLYHQGPLDAMGFILFLKRTMIFAELQIFGRNQ